MSVDDLSVEVTQTDTDSGIELSTLGEAMPEKLADIQKKIDANKEADSETIEIEGVPPLKYDQIASVVRYVRSLGDQSADIRRKARLIEIRQKKELHSKAMDFLADMVGSNPYRQTFTSGFITVTFQLPSATQMGLIQQQLARDVMLGRIFSPEDPISGFYRLAMAIVSCDILPPGASTLNKHYVAIDKVTKEDRANFDLLPQDMLPRARYEILNRDILKSSTNASIISNAYMKFDQEIADLQLLAVEDPDFFREELTLDTLQE